MAIEITAVSSQGVADFRGTAALVIVSDSADDGKGFAHKVKFYYPDFEPTDAEGKARAREFVAAQFAIMVTTMTQMGLAQRALEIALAGAKDLPDQSYQPPKGQDGG